MRLIIIAASMSLAACTQQPQGEETIAPSTREALATSSAGSAEGTAFDVPSDRNARYSLLQVVNGESGNIVATTRREGSSGTTFARREIDCAGQTFRYVGEGDTLEDANQPAPNPGEMAALVDGSISDVAVKFACANQ